MENSPRPYASRSASNPLLHGRPYIPPPGLKALEGAASSITTTSSSPSLGDGKAVTVRAVIPSSLAQAMVDIVVVDSPGVTPTPPALFLATPVPFREEADELEPGAPDPRAAWVRARSDSQEQPGSTVTVHVRKRPAAAVADLDDRKDHKAKAPANPIGVVVAEPAGLPPQPQVQVQPLEVIAADVVAGHVVQPQGLCDKMAIGLRVGTGNAMRELVAGGLRVATHVSVARAAYRGAQNPGATGAMLVGTGIFSGGMTAALLAADALRRLAGDRRTSSCQLFTGLAVAGGIVPFIATGMATSTGAAVVLHSNFLGRLAGALVTETLMQLTDGVTARARLAAPLVDPLEPAPLPSLWSTLFARPVVGMTAYIGLGAIAELMAGPSIARALEGLGLSAESAKAAVMAVPELCFALWDSIAMAAAACSDDLDLVLEPGRLSALAGNLGRFGETLARIGELSGTRVLANSPLDFVRIGMAMHPGSPGMEVVAMFVRHLSRIRGYIQQETHTPAGTMNAAAQDFLAAHDAFLGSSGAGIDIRRRAGAFGEPDDLV